ncbi:sulfite exporter TauE/SafE family protein [Chryseolinea sp. T2]|uniref:sulfite exporter TauE/SafE family protein n=1 Tax=Chryseolinea sp. T2 TaxID=3129255 RepID=UPI003078450D
MVTIESIALLFLSAFVAFSLSAVSGGGAGLLLIPVIGFVAPVVQVPAILSIGTATSSVSRIVAFKTHIQWKIVGWFVPAAVPAVFLGAWLLRFVNPHYLELGLGLFLISNWIFLFRKKNTSAEDRPPHRSLLLVGFFAGFLSGLTGAVGLLFNRFYLRWGMTKEQIVATRAANEVVLHIIKIVLYTMFGLLNLKVAAFGFAIAIASIASSWFMTWGLSRISESLFRTAGYVSMVISGLVMTFQSVNVLVEQNNASVTFSPIALGVESKIQWQNAGIAFEFQFDEGLEFEQTVSMNDVPEEVQKIILAHQGNASNIVVEEVHGLNGHSFEAYYFSDNKLLKKCEFPATR